MHGSTVGPPSMSDTKCTRPARVSVRTVTQKHFYVFGLLVFAAILRKGRDWTASSRAKAQRELAGPQVRARLVVLTRPLDLATSKHCGQPVAHVRPEVIEGESLDAVPSHPTFPAAARTAGESIASRREH